MFSSVIHNSQKVEASQAFIDGYTDKTWPICTNEYSSALKRKDALKSKHMTLEDIMQSERH